MLLIYAASVLLAQSDRGVITGTVKDATGAVVPGAQVTAVQVNTNASNRTTSTSSGDFTVASLPVGAYRVRIEKQGFKTHFSDNVQLTVGGSVRVDAVLELGSTQQTVEVTATVQLLQSESAKVSSQVANKLVDELPLVVGGAVRSPFDLATLTPEVGGSGTNFRIGGGKTGVWNMTLDGISTSAGQANLDVEWVKVNTPSLEAITEFAVESGGFKAEFGHATGGMMTFVSKSGTNTVHGSAYEFARNDALDARGFFGATKQVYKQHDFGASLGGPVVVPKLYNGKDKTFFFFSYEGFRNRVGATATPYSVAPPEFYTGDLRNWVDSKGTLIQIYDPATTSQVGGKWVRQPFVNNQIPQTRFDSLAKIVMPFGAAVKPNVPGLVPGTSSYVRNNYLSYGVSITPFDKTSIKVDQYLNSAHRVAFYFGRTHKSDVAGPSGAPGLPDVLSSYQEGYRNSDVYRFSWDYTISPRLLNRFYAGGNNWLENHGAPANHTSGWKDKVCMKNVFDCNANLTMVDLTSEFTQWGGPADNGSDNIVVGFNDDMTFISGRHTYKWGYMYDNTHYNAKGQQNISGYTSFNRLGTSVPLDTNQATGGGSAFAAFLLGQAYSGAVDVPRFIPTQFRYHAAYIQDDFRLSQRLTLNYGVRYEFNRPPLSPTDEFSDFDPLKPNPGAGGLPGAMIFAGFGPGRENKRVLNPGWYGGIGPRLGFSYGVDGKTVLRGAVSRSFGAVRSGARHSQGFTQQMTFSNTNQGLDPTFIYQDGLPSWSRPPFIDPTVANGASPAWNQGVEASRAPETLDFILNIQRQLSRDMVLEAGYHGANASHLTGNPLNYDQINQGTLPSNLNPFTVAGRALLNAAIDSPAAVAAGIRTPYPGFKGSVAQSLRPFPQFSGISAEARGGHSTYHSLTAKLEKRYSMGLTFQGSYVLSKILTDADTTDLVDQYNRRLEKAIASFDQTHSVKLSYVYEVPFGHGKKWLTRGLASQVLGGWRLAGIQMYMSGTPMNLGTTISFPIFNTSNRPAVASYDGWRAPIKGDKFDPNVDSYFQPVSFFGVQPTDRFGDMPRRNPKLRSFPGYNENLSLAKTFNIREPMRLDLRVEAFNMLNRTLFGALSNATTLQNPNFGLWRSQANDPRRMQVALKLYW
jgi:hypothetical protein